MLYPKRLLYLYQVKQRNANKMETTTAPTYTDFGLFLNTAKCEPPYDLEGFEPWEDNLGGEWVCESVATTDGNWPEVALSIQATQRGTGYVYEITIQTEAVELGEVESPELLAEECDKWLADRLNLFADAVRAVHKIHNFKS